MALVSTGWTVVLAVSIALNVIMGYREARRMMWKLKRKTRKTTHGGRGRSYSGRRGPAKPGQGSKPRYYRGQKYGGYGNQPRKDSHE